MQVMLGSHDKWVQASIKSKYIFSLRGPNIWPTSPHLVSQLKGSQEKEMPTRAQLSPHSCPET